MDGKEQPITTSPRRIAMRAGATLGAAAVLLIVGCSWSDGDASAPPESDSAESAFESEKSVADVRGGAPAEVARGCRWFGGGGDLDEDVVRQTFVDQGSEPVRLLLDDDVVRAGHVLQIAILNESSHRVTFGTVTRVKTLEGERVPIKGPYGFRLPLLSVAPGSVGVCLSAPVPSSTPSGDYVAVLTGVDGAGVGRHSLKAPFVVAGEPINSPAWETALRRAAYQNRVNR